MAIPIDPTYTAPGRLSCADVLLLTYFDVVLIGTVNFCTMSSILSCSSCWVVEKLVWVQAHGHSPDCVLLVTVDTSGVEMLVSVEEAGEVVVVLGASVVVIIGWTGVVVVWTGVVVIWTGVVVAEVVVLGTVKESYTLILIFCGIWTITSVWVYLKTYCIL